jgi:hypothetical protein
MSVGHGLITQHLLGVDTQARKSGIQQRAAARAGLAVDQPDVPSRQVVYAADAFRIPLRHHDALLPPRQIHHDRRTGRESFLHGGQVGLSGRLVPNAMRPGGSTRT